MKSFSRAVSPTASAAEVVATFRAAALAARENEAPLPGAPWGGRLAGAFSALLFPLAGLLAAPLLAVGLTASEATGAVPAGGALAVQALLALPGAPVAVAKCERDCSKPPAPAPSADAAPTSVRGAPPRAEARRFAPCAPILRWEAPSLPAAPRAF